MWKQKKTRQIQMLCAHKDHTSNIIAREMQKFVCRHAAEVSQVLPLPLPTSFRQSRLLQSPFAVGGQGVSGGGGQGGQGGPEKALDAPHLKLLLSSLAKVHAVSFAIKCKTPRLFDEINGSLAAGPSGARLRNCLEERTTELLSEAPRGASRVVLNWAGSLFFHIGHLPLFVW